MVNTLNLYVVSGLKVISNEPLLRLWNSVWN